MTKEVNHHAQVHCLLLLNCLSWAAPQTLGGLSVCRMHLACCRCRKPVSFCMLGHAVPRQYSQATASCCCCWLNDQCFIHLSSLLLLCLPQGKATWAHTPSIPQARHRCCQCVCQLLLHAVPCCAMTAQLSFHPLGAPSPRYLHIVLPHFHVGPQLPQSTDHYMCWGAHVLL